MLVIKLLRNVSSICGYQLSVTSYQLSVLSLGETPHSCAPFVKRRAVGISVGGEPLRSWGFPSRASGVRERSEEPGGRV
ncbi:hypothetical protein [Scytonema sp. PRP1]|uniref:hypothetical protein n=1 Tax=Scytonema sp. PRP1 TaxID=3120513 RepID=UPI00300D168F